MTDKSKDERRRDAEVLKQINQDVIDDPNVSPAQREVAERVAERLQSDIDRNT